MKKCYVFERESGGNFKVFGGKEGKKCCQHNIISKNFRVKEKSIPFIRNQIYMYINFNFYFWKSNKSIPLLQ